MSLDKIADKVVETDVLIMGGGIAGCPAAVKAREMGLNVVIAEKSKIERSGNAGHGLDHYGPFPREISVKDLAKSWAMGVAGELVDPNVLYAIFDKAFWALEECDRMGVNNKWDDGDYYFQPYHGAMFARSLLRVHWEDVKPRMAKAVRKSGTEVLDRVMIVDLLTNNGTVVGATAVNTRTGDFIVIKAKATVIATGTFSRICDPMDPSGWKYKFHLSHNPATLSGDGYAAAYRVGANLMNMDLEGLSAGSRLMRDPYISNPGNYFGNEGILLMAIAPNGEEVFLPLQAKEELEQMGISPVYVTMEHLNDDYQKRIEAANWDENMLAFKFAEERGFNTKTHRAELAMHPAGMWMLFSGIETDEFGRTGVKGLYAIGDSIAGSGGSCTAIPTGFIMGENLPGFVNEVGEPEVDEAQVLSQKQSALASMAVKDGTEPLEYETAIRYIVSHYVDVHKTDGKLEQGLRRLGSLKRVFEPQLMANNNPHHMMRCIEQRNLVDLAEVYMKACLARKETRGSFIRLDYPERDPAMDGMRICQRLDNGKPVLELKKVPELKPEYAQEEK